MGLDKATLPFGPGEVMLQRVVRLVSEAVPAERIVCVAAAGQRVPPLPPEVRIRHDAQPLAGPLAGLATGLAALENEAAAVFLTGCDTPLLVPAVITRLFELVGDYDIAAPHDGHRWHPLAGVYQARILPIADSRLAAGERSLIALIERCRTLRVSLDNLRDVDPQFDSLASCNTPEEYQRLLPPIS